LTIDAIALGASGSKNPLRAPGRLSVLSPDECIAPVGLSGRQLLGKVPGVVPRSDEAEVADHFVGASPQPIEHARPRRDRRKARLHVLDHRTEDSVDVIEIGPTVREIASRGPLDGGDAEVEIDVRVDAEQEVLENQWSPALGRPERVGLRARRTRLGAPRPHRIKVAPGEGNVQPRHPGVVLKRASLDGRVDPRGDVPVEGRKVSEPTPLFGRLGNDVVELRKNLIDGLRRHRRATRRCDRSASLLGRTLTSRCVVLRESVRGLRGGVLPPRSRLDAPPSSSGLCPS